MNISVTLLYKALQDRNIHPTAVSLANNATLLLFEYGGRIRSVSGTTPDLTSATGRTIANDKYASYTVAQKISMSTPATTVYQSREEASDFLKTHARVVVKPLDAAHGNGVTVDVTSLESLERAIDKASEYSETVILQQMVSGGDLRLLVIGGEVAAAVERVPASVVGDGVRTVRELIEQENTNQLRGENYKKPLNRIDMLTAEQFLGRSSIDSVVPASGKEVQVVGTANIGTGGRAINRTGNIPEGLCDEAVRFAKSTGLFVCGVDFIYDELAGTWSFIEANSSPSLGMHVWPSEGESIDVASMIIDKMLMRP